MTQNVLFLWVAIEMGKGAILTLSWIHYGPSDNSFPIQSLNCLQFSICVWFTITTKKAEGQSSSEKVGMDLHEDCFSRGRLYVTLRRNTHPSIIIVLRERQNPKKNNIVFHEVLSTNWWGLICILPMPVTMWHRECLDRCPLGQNMANKWNAIFDHHL